MTAPPSGPPYPGTPPAEVEIDEALVEGLVADQHPDLAYLPVRAGPSGWDNATYRLGENLAVRIPRRQMGADLLANEQRWTPALAPSLPLPISVTLRRGAPGRGYPWGWSIVPWLAGEPADLSLPKADQAEVLAAFFQAVHVPAPADAPRNPYRGVPLSRRAEAVEARMEKLAASTGLITPVVRRIWGEALAAPVDVEGVWLHGDPHPRNILVEDGRISAVIDWGDLAQGDCASDLAAVWMLFDDPGVRRRAIEAYGHESRTIWLRARGWAVFYGVVLSDAGLADDPRMAAIGSATLRRLEEDG